MEHYHLGELFIFTVVPLLPSLKVERGIGLELVQEKLLKLRRTGPRPSTLVVNSNTMSSLLCLLPAEPLLPPGVTKTFLKPSLCRWPWWYKASLPIYSRLQPHPDHHDGQG